MAEDQRDKFRFFVDAKPYFQDEVVDIWLRRGEHVALPVVMRKPTPEEEGAVRDPMLRVDPQAAADLLDALWKAGFRPSKNVRDDQGAMEAKNEHLRDLQAIAFHALKMPKGGEK